MKYRIFTPENQDVFAKLSGDYNPLHVDALSARRLLFGSPIVHGIHALLWSLDCYMENRTENLELHSLKAIFSKPIKVGDEVSLSLKNTDDRYIKFKISSGGTIVTRIEVELDKVVQQDSNCLETTTCFPKKLQPRILLDDDIEADSGTLELSLNIEAATKMFPHLTRCVSPMQIAIILNTTRLVGVICPGLHSLYSGISLFAATQNDDRTMNYEVTKFDKRYNLVFIKIIAPKMTGTIKAFRRPAPQKQTNYLTLKNQLNNNEFVNQRALIIGGSRGLGEVAAKLLSGGGANVKITYHQGKKDAHNIVDEIICNGGIADSCHFDVLNPKNISNILQNDWIPTHLYYFATPFIFSGAKGKFSPKLFNKFCDYYIVGFMNTLNQLSDVGIKHIFYPSTVAIDELPANMGEYVTAKIASEMLCTFLEQNNQEIIVYKPRFPRLATDQTASIIPITNQDPVPIMIKQLRSFRDS